MTIKTTRWVRKHTIALWVGCMAMSTIGLATWANASPEDETPGDLPAPLKRAERPNNKPPVPPARPDKALLSAAQVKENAFKARRSAAKKVRGHSAKGTGQPPSTGPAGKARGNRPLPGAGKTAAPAPGPDTPEAGAEDPWSNVNMPDELAAGIEYKRPGKGTRFSFNLVDVDLVQLIKIIGNITGKAFILGSKTPQIKATIYAPTKITAGEAYQAFLSVLQVNGLTVVPAGRYLKILALGGSTSRNLPIIRGRNVPPGDEIVTRLHLLKHISAEEIAELLGRFKSPEGDLTIYSPTNTLIITDYGSSIRRLLKLIRILDVPGTGEQIWIEPVNYADASELANRIMEIFDVSASASAGKKRPKAPTKAKGKRPKSPAPSIVGQETTETQISKILPDERTNSLIIVATETSYLRILELIKRLDVPIAGEGTLHVHKLQHADATELAKTLNNLSKRSKTASKKKGKSAQDASVSLFEGQVEISADKATNSLVIVSSLRDYMSLKRVIDRLDVMLRQVFVEAVIMEVSLDKTRDLGLGFHVGNTLDTDGKTSLIYGSSQPNDKLNSLLLGPGAMSGLAAGIRGPALEGTEDLLGVGISIPSFGVALQALQTNSDVNVLSTPHILATDNVEAAITVGENVPLQQGYNPMGSILSQVASSGAGNAAAGNLGGIGALAGYGGFGGIGGFSIARQNVGLTLKITPQINDDNQVRLEINLEIKEVKSANSDLGPNISQKSATTTSVVADQQTIIIGGLITDNDVITTQKVPFLGDIPILGFLFRQKSSINRKRNLLIFLTPYIIRTAEDFREIFNRKMAERREFLERWTAFEYHRVDPHLDWSRTNGVIAEMNRVISEAEAEEALRRESEILNEVEHTPKDPVHLPTGDAEKDESESDGTALDWEHHIEHNTTTLGKLEPSGVTIEEATE